MPVSLQNLLKIGQLKEHPPDAAEVQRLLAAAARNIGDARVTTISPETRFDAAYKAIMQAALAALMAQRFAELVVEDAAPAWREALGYLK
jgi:hypothetical protein